MENESNAPAFDRRTFLTGMGAGAIAGWTARGLPAIKGNERAAASIIDTHVLIGNWPFGPHAKSSVADLLQVAHQTGRDAVWVGTLDGLLHKDLRGANQRLREATEHVDDPKCQLIPIGTINPLLVGWEDDLQECHHEHAMPGIRLHPAFHGYALTDACFENVLKAATRRKMFIQIVGWLGDCHRPYLTRDVSHVDFAPLAKVVEGVPTCRVLISNGLVNGTESWVAEIEGTANIWCDYGGLEQPALTMWSSRLANQLVFGSSLPVSLNSEGKTNRDPASNFATKQQIYRENALRLLEGL